jgi:hypothetical protein
MPKADGSSSSEVRFGTAPAGSDVITTPAEPQMPSVGTSTAPVAAPGKGE